MRKRAAKGNGQEASEQRGGHSRRRKLAGMDDRAIMSTAELRHNGINMAEEASGFSLQAKRLREMRDELERKQRTKYGEEKWALRQDGRRAGLLAEDARNRGFVYFDARFACGSATGRAIFMSDHWVMKKCRGSINSTPFRTTGQTLRAQSTVMSWTWEA